MTAGTKISLAVAALLVVVLVLYYSALAPDGEPDLVVDAAAPSVERPSVQERTEQSTTPREPRQRVTEEPEPEAEPERDRRVIVPTAPPSGSRFLGDSVEQALSPREGAEDSRRPRDPLADRDHVTISQRPSDGGKDAPDTEPASEPADAPDASEAPEDAPAAPEAEPEVDEPAEADEPQPRPTPQPQPPAYTEHTVRSGDTMSSIAGSWFGDEGKWDLIAKANPLVDPNRLRVGQTLRLPPRDAEREETRASASAAQTTYVVRSGDSLSKIARSYYGDPGRWRIIFDANREAMDNDPDRLRVGMRLVIPPAPQPAE